MISKKSHRNRKVLIRRNQVYYINQIIVVEQNILLSLSYTFIGSTVDYLIRSEVCNWYTKLKNCVSLFSGIQIRQQKKSELELQFAVSFWRLSSRSHY